RGQCPRKFSATGSDAATVMRGPPGAPVAMSTTPEFILVGRRAEEFADIRIKSGDRELLTRALAGPRFSWPTAGARAVGFDLIFAYSGNRFRADFDATFLEALARN